MRARAGCLRFLVGPDRPKLSTAAIRYALDQPGVDTVAVGAKNVAEILDAIDASRLTPFTRGELERIERISRGEEDDR